MKNQDHLSRTPPCNFCKLEVKERERKKEKEILFDPDPGTNFSGKIECLSVLEADDFLVLFRQNECNSRVQIKKCEMDVVASHFHFKTTVITRVSMLGY